MLQHATAHPYCAILVPNGTPADQVEALAAQGKLPTHHLDSTSATAAAKAAREATGHEHILNIERHAEVVG